MHCTAQFKGRGCKVMLDGLVCSHLQGSRATGVMHRCPALEAPPKAQQPCDELGTIPPIPPARATLQFQNWTDTTPRLSVCTACELRAYCARRG